MPNARPQKETDPALVAVRARNPILRLDAGSIHSGERLIKAYFRHNRVRVVLKNLLTNNMLTNFLRSPLPYFDESSDENILLIRGSLDAINSGCDPGYVVQWCGFRARAFYDREFRKTCVLSLLFHRYQHDRCLKEDRVFALQARKTQRLYR